MNVRDTLGKLHRQLQPRPNIRSIRPPRGSDAISQTTMRHSLQPHSPRHGLCARAAHHGCLKPEIEEDTVVLTKRVVDARLLTDALV